MRDFFNEMENDYFCTRIENFNVVNSPNMISIFDDMNLISEAVVQRMLPLVDEPRRTEALRYRHLFGQYACLKSWLMLKDMLKPLGISNLEMNTNAHGKPYLVHYPDIHFNLSHCKNGIAVAVDKAPIGIDIESFRSADEALLSRTMNNEELQTINSAENPTASFIAFWTMKEAVLKLRGTGIVDDLHHVLDGEGYSLETHIVFDKQYAWSVARIIKPEPFCA